MEKIIFRMSHEPSGVSGSQTAPPIRYHICRYCSVPVACHLVNCQCGYQLENSFLTSFFCGPRCFLDYISGYATQEEEDEVSGEESSGQEDAGGEESDSTDGGEGKEAP